MQDTRGVRRALGTLGFLAVVMSMLATVMAGPATAASTIETQYKTTGTWAVSTANVTDSGGKTYVLYYPTNLGAGGVDHAILTWGNGTNATPSKYTGILNHLASWGFVVIASTSTATGFGTEMLAGVNYLIAQNGTSSSIFYQNLDTTKVGALGHSQGASGALNATTASNGVIKTTVTVALPNPTWVSSQHRTDFTRIVNPVLFVHGSSDFISTASGQTGYYNQVAGAAAKATLTGAGHNTIQGSGGGFLGYITAWLMYVLPGDTTARGAFVGSPPEINTNTNWQNQAEKNLP
jgi:hypothetical protein